MKTILRITIFLSLTLTFFLSPRHELKAATAEDYVTVLQNISDSCAHGRHIIFRDTNADGIYDKIRKTNCDGTYTEDIMSVSGNGSFGRIGAYAQVTSGNIDTDYYRVRIYFPSDNATLGYLAKDPGYPAVFTFDGGQ